MQGKQSITIQKISITKLSTDIIVNAANSGLQEGGGVCGYIFQAAGSKQLQDACNKIGGCKTGSAVITPGFKLCKYIVHAVGPVWHGGNNHEPQDLYSCYRKSMNLAKENNCHSIGFPLISAGIFGYPKDKAWRKALQAVNDWLNINQDYDIDVIFAILDKNIIELGRKTADDLGIHLGKTDNSSKSETSDKDLTSSIHSFAVKYRNLFSESQTQEIEVIQTFAEECFGLGFEMDTGKLFISKYSSPAFQNAADLIKVLDSIDDIEALTSGIFSKWRYITHWSYYDSLLTTKNRMWFIAAFYKLSAMTSINCQDL